MHWYLKVIKNYVGFSGRARRKEYWMYFLFNIINLTLLGILEITLDLGEVLSGIYSLLLFLPSLAVTTRRLHDTGKSAWWLLIVLVPIFGPITLLVFMCQDSQVLYNDYGPNPKTV